MKFVQRIFFGISGTFVDFSEMSSEKTKVLNVGGYDKSVGDKEKKRKESILDLSKYLEKSIRVKFAGGREATGILKGFDQLLNLVLDNTMEYVRDQEDCQKITDESRSLGLVVCRGTNIILICPQDGMEQIANPFISQ